MHRLAWFMFALCLAAAATFIVVTTGQLPEHVASHFGPGNAANAFMSRGGYLVFILAFALVLPIFVAAMVGLLPRMREQSINIPHKAYWLDPKRREDTMNALSAHGAWLGSLIALFIAALHYVLLVANRSSPPLLPMDLFLMLVIAFVVGIALWIGTLYLRFRNTN